MRLRKVLGVGPEQSFIAEFMHPSLTLVALKPLGVMLLPTLHADSAVLARNAVTVLAVDLLLNENVGSFFAVLQLFVTHVARQTVFALVGLLAQPIACLPALSMKARLAVPADYWIRNRAETNAAGQALHTTPHFSTSDRNLLFAS